MTDPEQFKQVLARWATGVTVVTARAGDRIHGMTVTAFTEVSLSPPLVLVCADLNSNTHPVIAAGKVFSVNILAADQASLSSKFASKKDEDVRFEGLDCATAKTGAPLLPGAVANLDCRLVASHPHGDHVVYVGEVVDITIRDKQPLLYSRGVSGIFQES